MPVFTFRGRVQPETLDLSIVYEPVVKVADSELFGAAIFAAKVEDGQMTIEVTVEDGEQDYANLHFYATDLSRTMMDVAALRDGVAYRCDLTEVDLPDGTQHGIVLADRILAQAAGHITPERYEAVLDLALTDMQIARVVSDAAVMLSWSHYTPIAAGRIVDALVRIVTGGRDSKAWSAFREAMRVDRAYLQFLTDAATAPRHGNRVYVSGSDNKELATRAWTLLDRFVIHRLSGALDPEEFPFLHG